MTIFQRWKQTALHNKALVLTAVMVAIGTIVSTGALIVQVCITSENNRKTSEQIDKLLTAANDMSEAADNFSDSSYWMEQHTDDAAEAIQDSVDTAERNTKITIKNAQDAFRDDQRAWVVPMEVKPPDPDFKAAVQPHWSVVITNTGKTPALKTHPRVAAWPYFKDQPFTPHYTALVGRESVGMISPGARPLLVTNPTLEELKQGNVDMVKAGTQIWYVFGEIEYEDVYKRAHTTTFCFYLAPDLTSYYACNTYNDAR